MIPQIPEELLDGESLLRPLPSLLSYTAKFQGQERELELREVRRGHYIASNHSVIFGDVAFLRKVSEEIAGRIRRSNPEVILTAESKAIYLAGKVTEELGLERFEVCRKTIKGYNKTPLSVNIRSTISGEETLVLDQSSKDLIKGKRVALIDDVVTTGGNMIGMGKLASMAGGEVVSRACIWVEGVPMTEDALIARRDLVYLSTLPEFFDANRLLEVRERFDKFMNRQSRNELAT